MKHEIFHKKDKFFPDSDSKALTDSRSMRQSMWTPFPPWRALSYTVSQGLLNWKNIYLACYTKQKNQIGLSELTETCRSRPVNYPSITINIFPPPPSSLFDSFLLPPIFSLLRSPYIPFLHANPILPLSSCLHHPLSMLLACPLQFHKAFKEW